MNIIQEHCTKQVAVNVAFWNVVLMILLIFFFAVNNDDLECDPSKLGITEIRTTR